MSMTELDMPERDGITYPRLPGRPRTPLPHGTSVITYRGTHTGGCTPCSWLGPERDDELEARRDCRKHSRGVHHRYRTGTP